MKTTALLHFLLTSPQKWELKSVTDIPFLQSVMINLVSKT